MSGQVGALVTLIGALDAFAGFLCMVFGNSRKDQIYGMLTFLYGIFLVAIGS